MKYVLIGKIVNTHALKGEVRLLSDFKYKTKVFIAGMKIYVGKNKIEETIATYRHHKMFDMITMDGYDDINQVLKYKGDYVFVNKEDIKLGENEYLDEDIIGLKVVVNSNDMGIVKRIDNHNGNQVLVVNNENKNYLIPYNFDIIENVDLKKKEICLKNVISGLFN